MIKINLLDEVKAAERKPGEAKEKISIDPDQQKKNIIFGIVIGIGLVVVAIWYFTLSDKYNSLLKQKSEKEQEYKKVQALIAEVEKYRAQKALLEKQINLIEELKMKQKGPADLMKRLYNLLPDQVFLKKLVQQGSAISINGEALNDPSLSNFYKSLDSSPYFVGIAPGKKVRTRKSINFDLSCRFIIDPAREKAKLAKTKKVKRAPQQPKL